MIMSDRFFNKNFIWKIIWVGIGTILVCLLFLSVGFSTQLSPALVDQNDTPTQQVDTTTTPAYSPKTNFHWSTKTVAWNAVGVVDLIPADNADRADVILSVKQSYHEGGGTVENIAGGVVGYTSEEFGHVDGIPLFVHQNKSYLITDSLKQAHYDSVNEQASVAMHELGHDLGLEHSDSPHSIMQQAAPTYLDSIPEVDAKHLAQLYAGVPRG